jgi:hypothetical protein
MTAKFIRNLFGKCQTATEGNKSKNEFGKMKKTKFKKGSVEQDG